MPETGTLICYVLVGLLFAAAARLYLRDARDRRAGRGDDAFAWRRNSHPNAPAAPKPVLQVLPRRWGRRHLVIAGLQAAAIGGGLWLIFLSPSADQGPVPWIVYPVTVAILYFATAFVTFLLTWAADLASVALARRRARSGQRQ